MTEVRSAASWRSSWGVAIRMARREVRRHFGRSLVVLLMVGIPTALLTFALASYTTQSLSEVERYAIAGGSADAVIHAPSFEGPDSNVPYAVVQDGHTENMTVGSTLSSGKPIPGYAPSGTAQENAAAIGKLVGATAIAVETGQERVALGDRRLTMTTLVADARLGLGSKAELLTGRWPTKPNEIVVTPQAIQRGLPTSGSVSVVNDKGTSTMTVVGTARAWTDWGMADWVALHHVAEQPGISQSWLVMNAGDVTYDRVSTLSAYGLPVISRYLIAHPPSPNELPIELQGADTFYSNEANSLALGGGAILILVTGLLVAPAFAVSASRQRRTLALAASNGATTGHLRRIVLSQALVLGVLAALLGSGLGIAAAAALPNFLNTGNRIAYAPFDIPWVAIAGVTACAVLAAVLAALIPARRLGRLDIVGVMRGQNVSPAPNPLLPIIGTLLMVGGSIALITGMKALSLSSYLVPLGVVTLILGALFMVPLLLVASGTLASRFPLPVRMAARDAARQRARSGPAVAAIVGGVSVLVTLLIAITSDTIEQERQYVPSQIKGEGTLYFDDFVRRDLDRTIVGITERFPTLRTVTASTVSGNMTVGDPGPNFVPKLVSVQVPGCTPAQAIYDRDHWVQVAARGAPEAIPAPSPCQVIGDTTSAPTGPTTVMALPAEEIIRRTGITDGQAQKVRSGGAVVLGRPEVLSKGELTLVLGTQNPTDNPATDGSFVVDEAPTVIETLAVPAVSVAPTSHSSGVFLQGAAVLVSQEVLHAHQFPLFSSQLLMYDTQGPISESTQEGVNALLGEDYGLMVERGFEREDQLAIAILVTAFALIMLVVTLTSTALSLAEQQREDATMAAVGATRGTRRLMSAGQAIVTSGIGSFLGLLVGAVCGYAFTYPLTALSWDPNTGAEKLVAPTLGIPWAWLAVAVIGVPLLAAALAALGVRRAPVVTRRLA